MKLQAHLKKKRKKKFSNFTITSSFLIHLFDFSISLHLTKVLQTIKQTIPHIIIIKKNPRTKTHTKPYKGKQNLPRINNKSNLQAGKVNHKTSISMKIDVRESTSDRENDMSQYWLYVLWSIN